MQVFIKAVFVISSEILYGDFNVQREHKPATTIKGNAAVCANDNVSLHLLSPT